MVLGHFDLNLGFLAKNYVGERPPDLKGPLGGDFSSSQVHFDPSCRPGAPEIREPGPETGVCEKNIPSGNSSPRRFLRPGALHPTCNFARSPNLRSKVAQNY